MDVAEHCVAEDGNSDSWIVLPEPVVVERERPCLIAEAVDTDELFAVEVAVDRQLVETDWLGYSFFVAQLLEDDEYNSSGVAAVAAVGTAVAAAVVALAVAFPPPTAAV